jgi:hypothetical protein
MIRQLARMELMRLLRSPLAWILLAIVQFLLSCQLSRNWRATPGWRRRIAASG